MYKNVCIALACMLGTFVVHPATYKSTSMANTSNIESNQQTKDKDKEQKNNMKEKIKQAREQWNKLTSQQKEEVYLLFESQIQNENRLTDKLAELSIISSEDANIIKNQRLNHLKEMKEAGEFPISWPRMKMK